jgi:hypothetical protein
MQSSVSHPKVVLKEEKHTRHAVAGRTVLQIIPELEAGGAERTTIDIAEALNSSGSASMATVAANGTSFVLRPTPQEESHGLIAAFPHAKKQRYALGKTFARQFSVSVSAASAGAAASEEAPPDPQLPPVPQKKDLRLRHMFMGGGAVPPPRPPAPAPASGSIADASGGGAGRKRSSSALDAAAAGEEESEAARKAAKAARKAAKAAKKQ